METGGNNSFKRRINTPCFEWKQRTNKLFDHQISTHEIKNKLDLEKDKVMIMQMPIKLILTVF